VTRTWTCAGGREGGWEPTFLSASCILPPGVSLPRGRTAPPSPCMKVVSEH
jgi:hypothetical protein